MAGFLPGRAPSMASTGPAAPCMHCPQPAAPCWPAVSCRQQRANGSSVDARRSAPFTCSVAAVDAPAASVPSMGPDLWNRTYYPSGSDANPLIKPWYVVDAEGQTLGRLATMVATHLRGKTVATYQPSMDMGAYVVIVNAEKVVVTGNKFTQKVYTRHTGRPGSRKEETFQKLQARIPERIVELAVKGMLPKGRLGRHLFTHLKVYKGPSHPHSAQKPADITAKINKSAAAAAAAVPA